MEHDTEWKDIISQCNFRDTDKAAITIVDLGT